MLVRSEVNSAIVFSSAFLSDLRDSALILSAHKEPPSAKDAEVAQETRLYLFVVTDNAKQL
jgi:hypothetical protein